MKFQRFESALLGECYHIGRHESGLEVVVIPKNQLTLYAALTTRYGSRDNTFKTSPDAPFVSVPDGIAHFLEHKMFENEDGSDTFSRFSALGASANAYTSNDMTTYLFSATQKYYESLEVLLDFVTHPYFTKDTVNKEMGIIEQELKMYEDNPHRWLYQELVQCMYQKNTVRLCVGGTVDSIHQITHETLYDCYNTFYSLGNMTLILSGNVELDRVREVLDGTLTEKSVRYIEKYQPDEPREPFMKRSSKHFPIAQPLFAIGLKETDLSDADGDDFIKREAEHTLLTELIFSKSSSLYNKLYENGLIRGNFGASYEASRFWSHLVISGESKDCEKVFSLVKDELDDWREGRKKLDTKAFERAKKVLYADAVQTWNSTSDIAESFLDYHLSGADMMKVPQILSNITPSDLEERLKKSYDTKLLVMCVAESEEKK